MHAAWSCTPGSTVVADVVWRYDIDGVHIDDYFYPYPVKSPQGVDLPFPDEPSWQRYLASGGRLARDDWRRDNVDRLIERLYREIHATKPWVRFGVSPFGLPRPDRRPAGISGFSQYDTLYADVERWWQQGWMDYLAPQLYWPIGQAAQAFEVLLQVWRAGNEQQRHLWPGLFTSPSTTTVHGRGFSEPASRAGSGPCSTAPTMDSTRSVHTACCQCGPAGP